MSGYLLSQNFKLKMREKEGGREGERWGLRLRYRRYPSVLGKINNIIVGRSVWNARLDAKETFFRLNTRLQVK